MRRSVGVSGDADSPAGGPVSVARVSRRRASRNREVAFRTPSARASYMKSELSDLPPTAKSRNEEDSQRQKLAVVLRYCTPGRRHVTGTHGQSVITI